MLLIQRPNQRLFRLKNFSSRQVVNGMSTVSIHSEDKYRGKTETESIPKRHVMVKRLKKTPEFDILIVGAGATGAGAALDAAQRGLKVACVEREDFASGTSSRSTKLIWAGSRYLVMALVNLFHTDLRLLRKPRETIKTFVEDFRMVLNCHRERTFLLKKQDHLTNWLPIAVPITSWLIWPPPFKYPPAALGPLGLFPLFFKFYDFLGNFSSPPSHIMSNKRAERKFPMLSLSQLKYCPVFYEGQHDDARTNLAIAQTAAREGATIANYCNVEELLRDNSGKVIGAMVRDTETDDIFQVKARGILFCGGPFTDELRKLEDPDCKPAVDGASGIHIVMPGYYAPSGMGLVDMATSDGRFLFFIPWEGHVVVGTTDHRAEPDMRPIPAEAEIRWLLNEAAKYLDPELHVRRSDVLSAWSGIRPLAVDPNVEDSSQASRDHIVSYNKESGVVFISGGKWTTYREMAEDAVDKVIEVNGLADRVMFPCMTLQTGLVGKIGYTHNMNIRLIQEFGIAPSVSHRLTRAYGGRAYDVCRIARDEMSQHGRGVRLVPGFPFIEAEVVFAARHDWALHANDFLARRCRLAFLDKDAATASINRVVELMGKELLWDEERMAWERTHCHEYLQHFGGPRPLDDDDELSSSSVRMATDFDLNRLFDFYDKDSSGKISKEELLQVSAALGHPLNEEQVIDCLQACDEDGDGYISKHEFVAWWNSDSSNPNLKKLKHAHATVFGIEGSGSIFG
jgi:glycerol-3-phosphate dehydrogenase